MLRQARHRAKKQGVPCTLTVADFHIPEVCPVLGIRLQKGRASGLDSSPSLDRVYPPLGYVPGNVIVVSTRANRLKDNGSPDEHQRIADFYSTFMRDRFMRPAETDN